MPDTDTTAEAELEQALDPFARVYRIQPPGKDSWPDDKPNSEFIPSAWPTWGDFKRAAATLDASRRAPTPPGGEEDETWRKPPPHFKADPRWQRQPQSDEEWDRYADPAGDGNCRAKRRLAFAGDLADPRAPQGMALVSRWDVNTVLMRLTWLEARFENTKGDTLPPAPSPGPVTLPDVLEGHWTTPGGHEMAEEYARLKRTDLAKADVPDFALANAVYLASRSDLDLIVWQTAAKERIRWLSAQLSLLRSPRGEASLKADFTRAFPGGAMDDSTFSAVEDALDRADAPCRTPDDSRWLTLPERIAALPSPRPAEEERLALAAQAVIDRWDTPNWKDLASTSEFIGELRQALAALRPATQDAVAAQPQPEDGAP